MRKLNIGVVLTMLFVSVTYFATAQNLKLPNSSPKAKVYEQIGITDVFVKYHRPGVKGREGKIWGGIVPYSDGKSQPWRAGANDNTIIAFSHPVKINGKSLAAGKYGLHVLPTETEWTFIFSSNTTSWGSYFYKKEEDVLRVTAPVKSCDHQEYLKFEFTDQATNSAHIALSWEKKKASFKVEVDLHETVLADIRNQLRHLNAYSWQSWNQAAQYCLTNDVNLEEGLKWAQYSIDGGFGSQPTFQNYQTKSKILAKLGKTAEADKAMASALELANMRDLHFYGRSLIQAKKPKEAMAIFEKNRKQNPKDNFTTLVGLARGNMALGNNKKAIKYFREAAPNAPQGQEQAYLNLAKQLEEKGK